MGVNGITFTGVPWNGVAFWHFCCGRKWNNIYWCTMKRCGILTVKNPLMKSVCRSTGRTICSRVLMFFCVSVSLQNWRWRPPVSRAKQWQPSATILFRMRGRKICAQTASSPKRSTIRMDQRQWKARVAIWQPCTPAVPIRGGRISRHLRYACASRFSNILSHHCHYTYFKLYWCAFIIM